MHSRGNISHKGHFPLSIGPKLFHNITYVARQSSATIYTHGLIKQCCFSPYYDSRFNAESLISWNMWQILPVFIGYLLFYDLTMRTWKLVFTFKDFKQWLSCVLVYTNWLTSKKNPKRRYKSLWNWARKNILGKVASSLFKEYESFWHPVRKVSELLNPEFYGFLFFISLCCCYVGILFIFVILLIFITINLNVTSSINFNNLGFNDQTSGNIGLLLIIDRHPYEINREKKEQSINVSVRLVHAGTCFYAYAPLC